MGPPTVFIDKKLEEVGLDKEKGFFLKATGQKIFGLVQCKVLAPSSLFIPGLPFSFEGRLYYALCRECVRQHRPGFCTHTDEERAFEDVFVSEELAYAVNEMDYKLVTIFEMHMYLEATKHFSEYYVRLAK